MVESSNELLQVIRIMDFDTRNNTWIVLQGKLAPFET